MFFNLRKKNWFYHAGGSLCLFYYADEKIYGLGRRNMALFDEIKKMIVKEFALDDDEVLPEAHLQDDLGGDSLCILNLSEAIAKRYGITLQADDIVETENVAELVELVKSKIHH
jgi:acyl carrier protein